MDFLHNQAIPYAFFDYKKSQLSQADFDRFAALFGDKLINKQGTTYRKLEDNTKAVLQNLDNPQAYALVKDHQSVLKRPILVGEFQGKHIALIGFDEASWRQWMASVNHDPINH